MKRRLIAFALAALVSACGGDRAPPDPAASAPAAAEPTRPAEPLIQGKPLAEWIGLLDDRRQRPQALKAIAEAYPGDERALPALEGALERSHDVASAKAAVAALSRCGAAGYPALCRALGSSQATVKKAVEAKLVDLGRDVVPALVDALGSDQEPSRQGAIAALARLRSRAHGALEPALGDANTRRRAGAAEALALGDGARLLVKALASETTRAAASAALLAHGAATRAALEDAADDAALGPLARPLLAKLTGGAADGLIRALADPALRDDASRQLVELADGALPALVDALRSADDEMTLALSDVARRIGKPAAEPLAQLLDDDSSAVRRRAVAALVDIPGAGIERLIVALGDEHGTEIAVALGAIGDGGDVALVKAVRIGTSAARAVASKQLAKIVAESRGADDSGSGRARLIVREVVTLVEAKDAAVRSAALTTLGMLGDAGVQSLAGMLGAKNADVRTAAATQLTGLGAAAAVPLAQAAMMAEDPVAKAAAAKALAALGPEAVAPLAAAAVVDDPDVRVPALAALVTRGAPAVSALVQHTRGGSGTARLWAIAGLADFPGGSGIVLDTLVAALSEKDPRVRGAAAGALSRLDEIGGGAVSALAGLLKDADAGVRISAAGAILRADPKHGGALGVLEESQKSESTTTRRRVARALGLASKGGRPVREALERASRDRDEGVRRSAAEGLAAMVPHDKAALAVLADCWTRWPAEQRSELREVITTVAGDEPFGEVIGLGGAYRGDRLRRKLLARNGGSKKTQQAVDLGLEYLDRQQYGDGSWNAGSLDGHKLGVTGLSVLAFLGAGHTHEGDGPYARTVKKGLEYILKRQGSGGCFGARAVREYQIGHAICTQALLEAYMLTGDDALREPATRAVAFTMKSQNPYLAWRYGVRDGDNDTIVTGWQSATLSLAEAVGVGLDREALQSSLKGAIAWNDRMTDPDTGVTGYQSRGGRDHNRGGEKAYGMRLQEQTYTFERFADKPTDSCTAMSVLLGAAYPRGTMGKGVRKRGVEHLAANPPAWDVDGGRVDYHAWFWMSQAVFHAGEKHWKKWNASLVTAALAGQVVSGADRGSWPPVGRWGAAGPAYSTAMMCLTLETYYRQERGLRE